MRGRAGATVLATARQTFSALPIQPIRTAFRRWFTLIAEYQAIRPRAEIPPEIIDCASLLRFSYREALKRHNDSWFMATGIDVQAPPGEIRAWHYPDTPLGAALFRVRPGSFEPADVNQRSLCAICRRQNAGRA